MGGYLQTIIHYVMIIVVVFVFLSLNQAIIAVTIKPFRWLYFSRDNTGWDGQFFSFELLSTAISYFH